VFDRLRKGDFFRFPEYLKKHLDGNEFLRREGLLRWFEIIEQTSKHLLVNNCISDVLKEHLETTG